MAYTHLTMKELSWIESYFDSMCQYFLGNLFLTKLGTLFLNSAFTVIRFKD